MTSGHKYDLSIGDLITHIVYAEIDGFMGEKLRTDRAQPWQQWGWQNWHNLVRLGLMLNDRY